MFKNYGVKEGLPSSEAYFAMQDSKGYMWFCTDAGVSRFNGYTFENFTTQHGLPDNVVFSSFEDKKGRIWFRSLSGKLSYFFNDSIYQIGANSQIKLGKNGSLMTSLFVDEGDTIWCGMTYSEGFYKISPGYGVKNITEEKIGIRAQYIALIEKNMIWGLVEGKGENVPNRYFLTLFKNKPIKKIKDKVNMRCVYRSESNKLLIAYPDELKQLENGSPKKIKIIPPLNITSIYEDKTQHIWLGQIKLGVYFFKDGDFSKMPLRYLNGYSVSSVFSDNEGGIWFTTLEKGVFYLPSPYFLNYTAKNGLPIEKIIKVNAIDDEKIIVSGERNEICLIKNNDAIVKFLPMQDMGNAGLPKNDTYISVSHKLSVNHKSPKIIFYALHRKKIFSCALTLDKVTMAKYFFHTKNGIVFFTSPRGLYQKNIFTGKTTHLTAFEFRTTTLYIDKENVPWFGTTTGLWNYKNHLLNNMGLKYPLLAKRIDDIKVSANNTWWLATKNDGIIIKKNDSLLQITKNERLTSNSCKSVFIDSNNTIWVSTNNGISKIIWKGWNNYSIDNFTTSDGLISDEINQIVRCGNNLYAASNSGVTVFNPDKLTKNIIPPPVHINKFTVNNTSIKSTDSIYNFTYNQNFITINFIGICYHKIGKLIYKYRLKGLDTTWHTTSNTSIQYTSLNPANYIFEVLAVTDDGIESIQAATLNFDIGKPFWLKWWFIALVVFTTLLIIVLIYNLRIAAIKNTESEKTQINKQIADIELKALRAQMNPHFIFNSINSIQHFILDNDRLSAQKYLTKFARLIRNVMENSKYEYILLAQELQTLKLYIELEILRSSFSFTYELEVDENLYLEKIVIPPMVLQPYVENAILHGIMPLNQKNGKVCIKIEKSNSKLRCIIDDNGIGRKQAQEYKAKKQEFHKSMALSITKERLDILNQTGTTKLSITIFDKYDDNGNARGTTVELFIPITNYEKNT